jgi:hypothetical protein
VEFILEVPPEKLMLMRLDYLFGEDWDLPPAGETDEEPEEIPLDPEFQLPEIELPDSGEDFEEPISRDFDPPLIEEEEGLSKDED